MNRFFLLFFQLLIVINIFAQTPVETNGYQIFYYPSGVKSSEGMMKDDQPEGFWKTYDENGTLTAEGNRKNHLLDSLWCFYNKDSTIAMQVWYVEGKKHGVRTTYLPEETRKEQFRYDVKNGLTSIFYKEGMLKQHIPYKNGLEEGYSYIYNKDGGVIKVISYEKGFITKSERINAYDRQKQQHGQWKWFYPNMQVKKMGRYVHGRKEGSFVEFDTLGVPIKAIRYEHGLPISEDEMYSEIEVKKTYYPNGKIKSETAYKDGRKHGLSKQYDTNGQLQESKSYEHGRLSGKGLISDNGLKQGKWFELYADSSIRAEGQYRDDHRFGLWRYYYPQRQLEQIGSFNDQGKPDGEWNWYYPSGKILRQEYYRNGLRQGPILEYHENGAILSKGQYENGLKEGKWTLENGDHLEEGAYTNDKKNGEWKFFHDNKKPSFRGKFVSGVPHGVHKYYNGRGKLIKEVEYMMGRKHGNYKLYNDEGEIILWIVYKNGVEKSIDGVQL